MPAAPIGSRGVRTGRFPDPIPAILFGQLAVDKAYAGRGIGSALLKHAVERAVGASDAIGGRAVIVRAVDAAAEGYWKANGFVAAKDDSSILFRSTADIAAWIQGAKE